MACKEEVDGYVPTGHAVMAIVDARELGRADGAAAERKRIVEALRGMDTDQLDEEIVDMPHPPRWALDRAADLLEQGKL